MKTKSEKIGKNNLDWLSTCLKKANATPQEKRKRFFDLMINKKKFEQACNISKISYDEGYGIILMILFNLAEYLNKIFGGIKQKWTLK
jgi:hypothetical protein